MDKEELLEKYQALNSSYKRKLIFHFGGEKKAGFYSELNTLLLSVLFALKFKYQFVLFSKDCQFAFGNGWNDFFEDFCPIYNNDFFGKVIGRTYLGDGNKRLHLYKILHKNIIENDIYGLVRSAWFEKENFNIPELGINGDLRHALKIITPIVYRFNKEYSIRINSIKSSIALPEEYVGFQIRGGDKITERDLILPQKYIEVAEQKCKCRSGYILTDDYKIFQTLKKDNPNWSFYSTVTEEEKGYVHSSFLSSEKTIIQNRLARLFASVDILINSSFFIGTYSTNPSLFIGMQKEDDKCFGMDYERWLIL